MPKGVPRAGRERGPPRLHSAQLSWASMVMSFALKSSSTVSSFVSCKVQAFSSLSPRICSLCLGEGWSSQNLEQEARDPDWNTEQTHGEGLNVILATELVLPQKSSFSVVDLGSVTKVTVHIVGLFCPWSLRIGCMHCSTYSSAHLCILALK